MKLERHRNGGLSDEEALNLITINPAKQLGIESRVGSLGSGADGDIYIFKNHPLSIYGVPQFSIVDGIVRFDRRKGSGRYALDARSKGNCRRDSFFRTNMDHDNCMRERQAICCSLLLK